MTVFLVNPFFSDQLSKPLLRPPMQNILFNMLCHRRVTVVGSAQKFDCIDKLEGHCAKGIAGTLVLF